MICLIQQINYNSTFTSEITIHNPKSKNIKAFSNKFSFSWGYHLFGLHKISYVVGKWISILSVKYNWKLSCHNHKFWKLWPLGYVFQPFRCWKCSMINGFNLFSVWNNSKCPTGIALNIYKWHRQTHSWSNRTLIHVRFIDIFLGHYHPHHYELLP